MKKVLYSLVFVAMAIVITGCGTGAPKTLTCTLSKEDSATGYKLDATYKVTAEGQIVKRADTTEIVTSDNTLILSSFETQLNKTYSTMNETYGGYDYKVTNDGKQVNSEVHIDYTKLDLDKLAKDTATKKQLMDNKNQITLTKIKNLYESMGATCK